MAAAERELNGRQKRMQASWPRKIEAWKMHQGGMKYADIGVHFGVCTQRARQLALAGERLLMAESFESVFQKPKRRYMSFLDGKIYVEPDDEVLSAPMLTSQKEINA